MSDPEFRININPPDSPTPGSFAYSQRKKNFQAALREARMILILMGTAIAFVSVVVHYTQWDQKWDERVRNEQSKLAPGTYFDPAELAKAREEHFHEVVIGVAIIVGVGFTLVILGLTMPMAPLPIAISALAIYVGYHAIQGVMDPKTIYTGLIWKFIVISGLAKAILAAQAYQADLRIAELEPAAQGRPLP